MPHPRAVFPAALATEYKTKGLKALASEYHSSAVTIRRWLLDRGVTLRGWGKRK